MKKTCIIMLMIILIISTIFCNYSYAAEENPQEDSKQEESTIDGLGNLSQYKGVVGNPTKFTTKVGRIIGIIQTVAAVISVVVLMAIGIKYMAGSVEEKADYKRTLLPYVIGAVLVFSISTLPQLIYNVMQAF